MPELFILAGCNGAGKTTAAKELLPTVFNTDIFINADNIAAQLNPGNVESVAIKAARIMLDEIQARLAGRQTFAIETTLASKGYLALVKQARLLGYEVILYFFYLPSAEMAKERVKLRVSKGGHNLPADVIERRYELGVRNFFKYITIVDRWYIFLNENKPSQIIARGEMPDTVLIYNFKLWTQLSLK